MPTDDARTLLYRRYASWMLLVHGACPPADRDWNPYAEALIDAARDGAARGILVLDGGHGPNAMQRERISQGGDFHLRTAVLTASRLGRGIVTALRWFDIDIRAFSPNQLDRAFDHLEVGGDARTPIVRELASMRLRLSGSDPHQVDTLPLRELQRLIRTPMSALQHASP